MSTSADGSAPGSGPGPSAMAKVDKHKLTPFIPAALLTLLTGGIMMSGGYLFATYGWAIAGPTMIPSGPLISIAFALARRQSRPAGPRDRRERLRHVASIVVGLPSPGADVALTVTAITTVVTLIAGAVMVVAGYATASWNPVTVPPLILAGGLIITVAFLVVDRADRARDQVEVSAATSPVV